MIRLVMDVQLIIFLKNPPYVGNYFGGKKNSAQLNSSRVRRFIQKRFL